jgi:hypothetical protein
MAFWEKKWKKQKCRPGRYIKALWQPMHEIVYIKAESKQITR